MFRCLNIQTLSHLWSWRRRRYFLFVCYWKPQRVESITLPVGRTAHQRIRFSCISDNTLHSAGASDSSDASCLIVSFMSSSRLQYEQQGRGGGEPMASGLPQRRQIEMWCVSAKVMDRGAGRMLVFRHSGLFLICNRELQKALVVKPFQVQLASWQESLAVGWFWMC